ncbi:protein FAR1-RELATED SEQUENCE 3-like [Telopea speciosissima]|uniref:protein FAR1-RELATED SEQUENCE 3-like n=1 Tax=Telopea speciosissima TaxID=54955 RepID=UPI001CC68119|nr:protein FAR1-RELATED SEQUENCE 3-like [Telopea speciosissima]
MDQNEIGSSDVFNDEMDSDSTSSQEENDNHNGNTSMEEEENNSFQSDESNSYNTSSENDLVDEFNEEEGLEDLGLDGDENSSQARSIINDLEPFVDMQLQADDEAYTHYNKYAKEMGFSVRKYGALHSRVDNHVIVRYYVCSN